MPNSTPAVDAAFQQLLTTLDTEIAEYRKIGSDVFHGGAPQHAQIVLRRANDHEGLRQNIASLHEQWKSGAVSPPQRTFEPSVSSLKIERGQPGLIRNIKGMTTENAAKMLGVRPAQVLAWLGAGQLKGYQKVGGTWKITKADLVKFSRDHRDLLVSASK
jgi:excisionase family DNA binding protein